MSRNSITTESSGFQSVEREGLRRISDRANEFGDGQTPPMNVIKLMVVSLAGWINQQQEDVIDYATAASGLADCFVTTSGMRPEFEDSNS